VIFSIQILSTLISKVNQPTKLFWANGLLSEARVERPFLRKTHTLYSILQQSCLPLRPNKATRSYTYSLQSIGNMMTLDRTIALNPVEALPSLRELFSISTDDIGVTITGFRVSKVSFIDS
jgi:hypothetical protein